MKYRDFHGTKVSEIGFGSSGFWGDRRFPETSAERLVHEAYFDHGINHFDTGHNYCNYNSEPRLGRALQPLCRSDILISSKAGTLRRKFGGANHSTTDFSPDYIETACAQSLANLKTDYLDIFYLHGIPVEKITDELVKRLHRMKRCGMVRFVGINTHKDEVMKHIVGMPDVFDVALIDFNMAQPERMDAIRMLRRAGISVMVGNVLAQGHLIPGKIGRIRSRADLFYLLRALIKKDSRRLAAIAKAARSAGGNGLSPAQAAMAYALNVPEITSCIFGTTNAMNLADIAETSERLAANHVPTS
jgi:aryl-alcohol dehydrogenase-like predicted oxidoreductase